MENLVSIGSQDEIFGSSLILDLTYHRKVGDGGGGGWGAESGVATSPPILSLLLFLFETLATGS